MRVVEARQQQSIFHNQKSMRALDTKTEEAAQIDAIPIASRMVRRLTTSQSMRNDHMKEKIEPL